MIGGGAQRFLMIPRVAEQTGCSGAAIEWVGVVGVRRALASADSTDSTSGRDKRGREQTDNAGEERAKTEAPKGHGREGGRQLQGRRASDGARERGGDERKEGRPSTFYSRRFASGELGRHACRLWKMNRFRCKCNDRLAAG